MKNAAFIHGCLSALIVVGPAAAQSPWPSITAPRAPVPCADAPCATPACGPAGRPWTSCCFQRPYCPDDYCPRPYPPACQPPLPSFYRCVPAGDCGCARKEGVSLWFIPTPRTLREALWCQP